jgi:two-component system, LytTR family, response regulator
MKALIIEDELNVREGFIKLLNVFCPEVEVVGSADGVESGLKTISQTDFDILFLDINLPDGSGFDLVYRLKERNFHIIFVTAYDKYAVEAFKISAVDYLLKPVAPDYLKKAIEKVKSMGRVTYSNTQIEVIQEKLGNSPSVVPKIILKDTNGLNIIIIADILYCQAEGSYTIFYLKNGQEIVNSENLKNFESLLLPYSFIRCHNSYMVNLNHVVSIQKMDGGQIVLSGDKTIPLSSRKKSDVMTALKGTFVN